MHDRLILIHGSATITIRGGVESKSTSLHMECGEKKMGLSLHESELVTLYTEIGRRLAHIQDWKGVET